jgi:phage/plasmid-like protein (TIGR03299 family)
MSANVESMAYAGRVPWHGLGEKVSQDMTPQQMLQAAKLDWEVRRMPLSIDFGGDRHSKFASHFSLSRFDGSEFRDSLGICGKAFVPVQNAKAFQFFRDFCESGSMQMQTAGSLDKGRIVWALASIKQGFSLCEGQETRGYLLLMSPHIWGRSLVFKFTSVEVVCQNTLVMALGDAGSRFRAPHVREFDESVEEEAKKALGLATRQLEKLEQDYRLLASQPATPAFQAKLIAEVLQPQLVSGDNRKNIWSERDQVDASKFGRISYEVLSCINAQPGAALQSNSGTMLGLLNAFTFYIDHRAGRARDNALTSAWTGNGARTKERVLSRLLELAKTPAKARK